METIEDTATILIESSLDSAKTQAKPSRIFSFSYEQSAPRHFAKTSEVRLSWSKASLSRGSISLTHLPALILPLERGGATLLSFYPQQAVHPLERFIKVLFALAFVLLHFSFWLSN